MAVAHPFEKPSGNRLLEALPHAVLNRLADHLEPVPLERGTALADAGTLAGYVYFPDRGLISLVKLMEDGRAAEVGFVGIDGVAGVSALLGVDQATFESIVQVEGMARRIKASLLRADMEGSHALKDLMLRYMHYKMSHLAQTAACNRLHTLRQRCCRWLLTAHDNARQPRFTLTHEFLALMMGVGRPSLSLTVAGLQRRGLIHYKRASLTIRNRRGLEAASCECYETLRRECERVCHVSRPDTANWPAKRSTNPG